LKRLLNTLYVTTPDSYLSKDGTNLVVLSDNKEIGRIPIHNLQAVICFGHMGASPAAMRLCTENSVSLSFMTPYGKFQAAIVGEVKGNVLLRREQYRLADRPDISLEISKNILIGKFTNSRHLLRRGKNDHRGSIDVLRIDRTIERISSGLESIDACENIDALRGLEGDVAKSYFVGLNELILKQKEDFHINCRSRRPPMDNMNSLLSFLYTMLAHDVKSALSAVGLDPYVGFLHTDRPGRPSLALDIMEEMRPVLVDRLALNFVNLCRISNEDFVEKETGGIIMKDGTRDMILEGWQTRKADEVFHPFIEEKIKIGLVPNVQSMLLSRYICGDIDGYPPFIMKQAR
jgi:CRISPR-associated protein Cas1